MTQLLLLTSPPASGKTYVLKEIMVNLDKKALVISPLRALAQEMKSNWGDLAVVMTPEEYLLKKEKFDYVILDEIHLFFYWGESFRPKMWEAFYSLCYQAQLVMGLSATLNSLMLEEFQRMQVHFSEIYWIDYGNQKLKYLPQKYLQVNDKFLQDLIFYSPKKTHCQLIFCQFRHEVDEWAQSLRSRDRTVLTCVGGEASAFVENLKSTPQPEFIICTTVLSHGVNLPVIGTIYFTYKVENIDFWIQMVARGGRKGESFDVFSVEKSLLGKSFIIKNYLAKLLLKIGILREKFCEQIIEWFLKVS